jgi:hypothetical protein
MKKSRSRWKYREREAVKTLQAILGRVKDPSLIALVTATGRVGHLTHLGADGIVGDGDTGAVVEVKARKGMVSADIRSALVQLTEIANALQRWPILVLSFVEDVPAAVERNWALVPVSLLERLAYERERTTGSNP